MSAVVFRRAVGNRRRWLFGWSLGIAAYMVLNIAFYPSFRDQADQMNQMFDNLPESLRSVMGIGNGVDPFSPVGYLSSQVFQLALPLLLIIAAISIAGSVAGDEEHGLLETVFSLPVSRRRVLGERAAAVIVLIGSLAAVAFVATAGSAVAVDLGVGVAAIAWASLAAAALAVAIGAVALALGAISGRKSVAIAVASAVAVTSYLITSLGDADIAFFRRLRPLSVFTHYDVLETLRVGHPSWPLAVLVAIAVLALVVALVALDHRDLRNA
jgi:ABC-2 type transport system permease protein